MSPTLSVCISLCLCVCVQISRKHTMHAFSQRTQKCPMLSFRKRLDFLKRSAYHPATVLDQQHSPLDETCHFTLTVLSHRSAFFFWLRGTKGEVSLAHIQPLAANSGCDFHKSGFIVADSCRCRLLLGNEVMFVSHSAALLDFDPLIKSESVTELKIQGTKRESCSYI